MATKEKYPAHETLCRISGSACVVPPVRVETYQDSELEAKAECDGTSTELESGSVEEFKDAEGGAGGRTMIMAAGSENGSPGRR